MFQGSEVWAPNAFTPPLSEDWTSAGPHLIALVEKHWRTPDGQKIKLDQWQKQLITAVLETLPDGTLRYRQVVISMGRQNGKSLLAAIFCLYGLTLHIKGPTVVGVASTKDQAQIVYDRTAFAVKNIASLSRKIKATGTRGLRLRDGSGSYKMNASVGDSLQGIPVTFGLADELHIMKPEVWDSIVNGQRAQTNALLLGITTAGDDESTLLKRLYDQGKAAIAGENDRFGFFLWEAPDGSTIDTPGALEAANPAIACGRIDADTVRADVRSLPETDQQRYALNSWVANISGWLTGAAWNACKGSGVPEGATDLVWAVDRSQGFEWGTIAVSAKVDGRLYTELVWSAPLQGSPDRLVTVLERLTARHGGTVALDNLMLKMVATEMRSRGIECWPLSGIEMPNAASLVFTKIMQKQVTHNDDDLLRVQVPQGKRKNVGDGWKISRSDSAVQIDSLMATVMGLYVAEVKPPRTMQIF